MSKRQLCAIVVLTALILTLPLQGQYGTKSKGWKSKGWKSKIKPSEAKEYKKEIGKQFALIIGINDYDHISDLNNAVFDAQEIEKVLLQRYGFTKNRLTALYNKDASIYNINDRLTWYEENLEPDDSLLIYFSGHGYIDGDLGFWLPCDVGSDYKERTETLKKDINLLTNEKNEAIITRSRWKIGYAEILSKLKQIKAKHVFLIMDSCYSAEIFNQSPYRNPVPSKNSLNQTSRQVMASGREKVSDGTPGKHSPFGKFLINFLEENTRPFFNASTLIARAKEIKNSRVEGGYILADFYKGGEFYFFLEDAIINAINKTDNKTADVIIGPEINPAKKRKKFPVLLVVGGVAVVVAAAALLMGKKSGDETPAGPEFQLSTGNLTVPEGGTATFTVKLTARPQNDVQATVSRISGDTGIEIQSGSSLTFTTSNWNQAQTVTVMNEEDADVTSNTATIQVIAAGISARTITVTEQDNDSMNFITDTTTVIVEEGRTASFQVQLSHQPTSDVQATVTRIEGDTDITVLSATTLTFTPTNWNTNQTVTLAAADDGDTLNGQTVLRLSAEGVQNLDITAVEDDKDSEGCGVAVSIKKPAQDGTVTGIVSIQAEVTGSCSIHRVEFYINNTLLDTIYSPEYSTDWDTSGLLEGPYDIKVVAYSTTGESAESKITVNVID